MVRVVDHLEAHLGEIDDVVFICLVPISTSEAELVARAGWERFEDSLVRDDPDLTDLERRSIAV